MNFLKKLFRSKFFALALSAAFLVSIIPAVLIAMGQGSYVHAAVQTVAAPFQWCFTKAGEGLSGYTLYFRTVKRLEAENARLKKELADVNAEIYDARLIEEENRFLRSYLGIKAENPDFTFVDAGIIGRESTNYRTVYTLSKGRIHGVAENMPVITEDGLVGYVISAEDTFCRVVPVIETAASVGAYVERTGVLGIVEGKYDLRTDGLCSMKYIDAGADIAVGDKIITSGVGSLYPRGLRIGEITTIELDEYNRTYTAVIRPYASPEGLTRVMIITNYGEAAE